MKNADCTIIVCSCDKYADLLSPFGILWTRYWADCPFETVLVTETEPANLQGFDRVIACGAGGNWSSRLVAALKAITSKYVLMLCDDYYLAQQVDTAQILKRLGDMKRYNALNLRMIPNPVGGTLYRDSDLLEYKKNTAYCIATQAGFWDREFLLSLAERTNSIWDLERKGSFMVGGETRPLLHTATKEFPFVDAVHKGYWEPFGKALVEREGIAYDFAKRNLPPFKVRVREWLKGVVFNAVPTTLLVKVQNALNQGWKEQPRTPTGRAAPLGGATR